MRTTFLDPGAMRHELLLQSAQTVADGAGGYSETWTETATVFAHIEPVRTNSFFSAAQRLEEATHKITIRYRADVKSGMRFEKQSRFFLIITVSDPDETRRYLVCTAREESR